MNQNFSKLTAWQKYDGNGFLIPGTACYRPINVRPKDGIWKQIPNQLSNWCCGVGDAFIVFRNITAASNITNIVTADGSINWTGTLANNQTLVLVLPNGYDQSFTITTSAFSGRTLTTANSYNAADTGVITPSGAISLTSNTTTFTTSSSVGSQYTAVLS